MTEDDVTGHTSRPNNGEQTRAYFTRWITGVEEVSKERDRRYEDRFKAQETATTLALAAQRDVTSVAFTASEKAREKYEEAQKDYNARSNEFRQALTDQNSTFVRRTEAEQQAKSQDLRIDELRVSLQRLEIWQGERSGSHQQEGLGRAQNNWLIGVVIGGFALLVSVANVLYSMATT